MAPGDSLADFLINTIDSFGTFVFCEITANPRVVLSGKLRMEGWCFYGVRLRVLERKLTRLTVAE